LRCWGWVLQDSACSAGSAAGTELLGHLLLAGG
jgi:hypothetical protein